MPTAADICRDFVIELYDKHLGVAARPFVPGNDASDGPGWRFFSQENIRGAVGAPESDSGLLIVDRELGLLLFLIPFSNAETLRHQVNQALLLCSGLAVERGASEDPSVKHDPWGAWRVAMTWLVEAAHEKDWQGSMVKIRKETGFSEEIAFDKVPFKSNGLREALEQYGCPRLLLSLREVLLKASVDESITWMSANSRVRAALARFDSQFQFPEKAMAREVVRALREYDEVAQSPDSPYVGPPVALESFAIEDFRNICRFDLHFELDAVSTQVIHGPNGSGKSAIAEALSVGFFGSSARYWRLVCDDRDRLTPAARRSLDYLGNYLSPLPSEGKPPLTPKFSLNGGDWQAFELAEPEVDLVQRADDAMSGTFLAQEDSLRFAMAGSDDLGARILRNYSDLADHVESKVFALAQQADQERQSLLRELGLNASIKKFETAAARISALCIEEVVPGTPSLVVNWIETVANVSEGMAGPLSADWRDWGGEAARASLAANAAKVAGDPTRSVESLRFWLEEYNELLTRSGDTVMAVRAKVGALGADVPALIERLDNWGSWLAAQDQLGDSEDRPSSAPVAKEIEATTSLLIAAEDALELSRREREHLSTSLSFIKDHWVAVSPQLCPTCGADHSADGGILGVAQILLQHTLSRYERLLAERDLVKSELSALRGSEAASGEGQCPISTADQSRIVESLSWLAPKGSAFADWIKSDGNRRALEATLASVSRIPDLPPPVSVPDVVATFSNLFQQRVRVAEATLEAPALWVPVLNRLQEDLARIVQDHLPQTLAKLWLEISLNLTSAPWLLPARPSMEASAKRGSKRIEVKVKGKLARYILNEAELHSIGLGWFFARYLTHGRFTHSFMVLDDPAQEMDETSCRDLSSFFGVLTRLHRSRGQSLHVVAMYGQERRAIELARATMGKLTVLPWQAEQSGRVESMDVVGNSFRPPLPDELLRSAS